jgi:hypothetical protein
MHRDPFRAPVSAILLCERVPQDKPPRYSSPSTAAIKILVNGLQILSIIGSIDVNLSLPTLEFMKWVDILATGIQASVSAAAAQLQYVCLTSVLISKSAPPTPCLCTLQTWLDCVMGDLQYKSIFVVCAFVGYVGCHIFHHMHWQRSLVLHAF